MADIRHAAVRRAYARLDLPLDASVAAARRRYRRMIRQWHPDRFGTDPVGQAEATRQMQLLNEAYAIVLNALTRKKEESSSPSSDRPAQRTEGIGDAATSDSVWAVNWKDPWNVLASALLGLWLGLSLFADPLIIPSRSVAPLIVVVLAAMLLPKIWWGGWLWKVGGTTFLLFMTLLPLLIG